MNGTNLIRDGNFHQRSLFHHMQQKISMDFLINYDVKSNGFSYLIESIYLFHKKKLKIKEIPFIFQERSIGKTKLSSFEILRFLLSIFHLLIYGIKEKPN